MFAPDEARHLWLDLNRDGVDDLNSDSFGYSNNWWTDWADTSATARQTDMRKYFRVKPYGSPNAGSGAGPNYSCTTTPITPLQDVTKAEGKQAVVDAIDKMAADRQHQRARRHGLGLARGVRRRALHRRQTR